jgi:hypothetical protein
MLRSTTEAEFLRDARRQQRREYRAERQRIVELLRAYAAGDLDYFYRNMTSDLFPWPRGPR